MAAGSAATSHIEQGGSGGVADYTAELTGALGAAGCLALPGVDPAVHGAGASV